MLQSDLHDAVRLVGSGQALLGFRYGPGHRLFAIEVFAGRQHVEEMVGMKVERAGNDDAVQVFHLEQAAVVVEGLDARRHLPGLIPSAAVHVSNGHQLGVWEREQLFQQILPAGADANHADPDAIICAKYARRGSKEGGRSNRGCFHEVTACAIGHRFAPWCNPLSGNRGLQLWCVKPQAGRSEILAHYASIVWEGDLWVFEIGMPNFFPFERVRPGITDTGESCNLTLNWKLPASGQHVLNIVALPD